ncbi:hypothetical protein [Sphingobium sp. Ant17]|nr:hypothetical protein [Sphingobium sp. Ant17]
MKKSVRIPAAQYPIKLMGTFDAWVNKITHWVEDAARMQAELLAYSE